MHPLRYAYDSITMKNIYSVSFDLEQTLYRRLTNFLLFFIYLCFNATDIIIVIISQKLLCRIYFNLS
jgi:hypothetical protein